MKYSATPASHHSPAQASAPTISAIRCGSRTLIARPPAAGTQSRHPSTVRAPDRSKTYRAARNMSKYHAYSIAQACDRSSK
jgi:hypothetical protein